MDSVAQILVVRHEDMHQQIKWAVIIADEFGSVEVGSKDNRNSALMLADRLHAVLGLPVIADCVETTVERKEVVPGRDV